MHAQLAEATSEIISSNIFQKSFYSNKDAIFSNSKILFLINRNL